MPKVQSDWNDVWPNIGVFSGNCYRNIRCVSVAKVIFWQKIHLFGVPVVEHMPSVWYLLNPFHTDYLPMSPWATRDRRSSCRSLQYWSWHETIPNWNSSVTEATAHINSSRYHSSQARINRRGLIVDDFRAEHRDLPPPYIPVRPERCLAVNRVQICWARPRGKTRSANWSFTGPQTIVRPLASC